MYTVPHVYSRCPWRPEEGFTIPKTGVTGGVKPSDVGAGKGTPFLCKVTEFTSTMIPRLSD